MHKRGLSVARCLSVLLYLPVTFVYCTHTAEDIVKLHPRPGNPIMLVFLTSSACIQFLGNHFSGGAKYMGWKNLRLSTEIAVYLGSGTRQAHGCYGTLIGSGRWRIDTCPFR